MSATRERPEHSEWAGGRLVEVTDEREPAARAALEVIRDTFSPHERQPLDHIAMEIREQRLALTGGDPYHLFVALSEAGEGMAVAAGVYLEIACAGLVTYLGVRPEYREHQFGRRMRTALVDAFRADAHRRGRDELAWVVGEIRLDNPWLHRLVRERAAVPFDLAYFHPGVEPGSSEERWLLYRQPVGDHRAELPAAEVRQLVYALWRRVYRVRWPLDHPGFAAMIDELEARERVGVHPDFRG